MAEKWEEIYSPEELKRVQALELQILKVFIETCDKLGLTYFLDGGTLLGAIRHKGFIPWDDDVDVGMPRADYERFVKEAPALLPAEYVLQTPTTEKNTPYIYGKLRLRGTRFIEYSTCKLPIEQGLYIDIFPMDEIPDDPQAYETLFHQVHRLTKLFVWRQTSRLSEPPKGLRLYIKAVIRWFGWLVLQLIPYDLLWKKFTETTTRYNGTGTQRMGFLPHGRMNEEVFSATLPVAETMFEGIPMKIPGDWEANLTALYGDYMTPPPEDQRFGGHKPYAIDLGE